MVRERREVKGREGETKDMRVGKESRVEKDEEN